MKAQRSLVRHRCWSAGLSSALCLFFTASVVQGGQGAAAESNPPVEGRASGEQVLPEMEGELSDFADIDLEKLLSIPLVESASRRMQSLFDAPSSITLITREQIEASGATNVPELLRKVPGVHVFQSSANNYSIGLRGLNLFYNNRVLVLQDGRQRMERLTGEQATGRLPIHPGNIERIEVIRGPGSILYGADALSGVVNIVTKRPIDYPGMDAAAWGGISVLSEPVSDVSEKAWMHNNGGAYVAHSWVNGRKTIGFRLGLDANIAEEWPRRNAKHLHGPFSYAIAGTLDYRPNADLTLFGNVGHNLSEAYHLVDPSTVAYTVRFSRQTLTLKMEKKRFLSDALTLKVHLDGIRMATQSRISLDVASFNVGNVSSRPVESFELHAQLFVELSLFDNRNITSIGGEGTALITTEYFTSPRLYFMGLILNNETRLLADGSLLLSLGARLEQIITQDDHIDDIIYQHFSPRLALTWKPSENHSLRISASSSYRTPTPFESASNIRFGLYDPPIPPVGFLAGNPQLRPEELYSIELGYRAQFFESLRVDAVLFGQRIENLIGDIKDIVQPVSKINLAPVHSFGVELGLNLNPSTTFSGYLNYTFVYKWDADTGDRLTDWPAHIYGLGTEFRLPWRTRLNFDAYLVFDYKPTLSNLLTSESGMMMVDWRTAQVADQVFVNLRLGRFLFDDKAEIFLLVRNILGFFREPEGLRAFPMDAFDPIGATLMIGIQLKKI